MSHKSNKFWLCALPVSLLILVAAYYIRVPAARRFIDAHTSLGRQFLGGFVHDTVVYETVPKPSKPVSPYAASVVAPPSPPPPEKPAPVEIAMTPAPRPVFDLQKLAGAPSLWPKKVVLIKATTFPAVVGGKVVGTLVAPAGAEANLKGIKEGNVGVEYQGGGAWLPVGDTDLETRVMGK
jgi:hypothetical protein